ncbi:hypothetical protein MMC06_004739 [Schaereria dolodes]|nr:hypothetical protein [Schaereria dolodes]
MRGGGVAQSYLDPLAVRVQSIRTGPTGRGWRRFLVFAELTKSKKGSEYVALFTYFSFEAWLRIVFAEGPRNVINALTLYSVMQANIIPEGKHSANNGHTPIIQFFVNVQLLADSDREQAAILFSMLFTLIIWVFSALSLISACILYTVFLWHHIPNTDRGLRGYCKRKIDSRVQKIVGIKINKALAKQDNARAKGEDRNMKARERPPQLKRQPTIPVMVTEDDDKLPNMPTLSRQTTQTTLPSYTSSSPLRNDEMSPVLNRQPTIPDMSSDSFRPMPPSRSATQSSAQSNTSYASNAPLIGAGGPMGCGDPGRNFSPAPLSRTTTDLSLSDRPMMNRSITASSQGSQPQCSLTWRPPPSVRGRMTPGPSTRQNTDMDNFSSVSRTSPRPPSRQNTSTSDYSLTTRTTSGPLQIDTQGRRTAAQRISPVDSYGRRTPGPQPIREHPIQEYEMRLQTPSSSNSLSPVGTTYIPYNLNSQNRSLVSPTTSNPASTAHPIQRNFSAPLRQPQQQADYFSSQPPPPQRSGTAPIPQNVSYDDAIFDAYGGVNVGAPRRPVRAARAGPGGEGWDQRWRNGPGGY